MTKTSWLIQTLPQEKRTIGGIEYSVYGYRDGGETTTAETFRIPFDPRLLLLFEGKRCVACIRPA